jgi:hypothetical protein
MPSWRLPAEVAQGDGGEQHEAPAELYLSRTMDGRRQLSGHLGPEEGAALEAAIASAITRFGDAEVLSTGRAPGRGLGQCLSVVPGQRRHDDVSRACPPPCLGGGGPGGGGLGRAWWP